MGSLLPTVCALAWQLTHTIRRLSSSKALGLLLLHRCSHNFVGTNQVNIEVAEQNADTSPLGDSFVAGLDDPVFQHPSFQPPLDHPQDAWVSNTVLHKAQEPCVVS